MGDSSTSSENQQTPTPRGLAVLKTHIIQNKVDVALWATRMLTIVFAIGYIIPIFG